MDFDDNLENPNQCLCKVPILDSKLPKPNLQDYNFNRDIVRLLLGHDRQIRYEALHRLASECEEFDQDLDLAPLSSLAEFGVDYFVLKSNDGGKIEPRVGTQRLTNFATNNSEVCFCF